MSQGDGEETGGGGESEWGEGWEEGGRIRRRIVEPLHAESFTLLQHSGKNRSIDRGTFVNIPLQHPPQRRNYIQVGDSFFQSDPF